MKLIIVESPGKIKTIQKYLGDSYTVLASNGHIMNLPEDKLGVDTSKTFEPEYVVIPGREKIITALKKAARDAESVFLAPDPDREGEAIASSLSRLLRLRTNSDCRIVFQEITESALKNAIENPRAINQNKVEAQKSRRVLDRLAGYLISPLLWSKVSRGLSAGRVQSVALLLICEREAEIERFIPEKYYKIFADYKGKGFGFRAEVLYRNDKKLRLTDEKEVEKILGFLKASPQIVRGITLKKRKENPPDPFITSSLQQEANQKHGFSADRTMKIAQKLYEGIELGKDGQVALITYMRTDSTRVSDEAESQAFDYIKAVYGEKFAITAPKAVKKGKFAQDAHEAIRPTYITRDPDSVKAFLSRDEFSLYRLIWQRFVASRMAAREFDEQNLLADCGDYSLESTAYKETFPGFRAVMEGGESSKNIFGKLAQNDSITPAEIIREDKETQPPARYSEATLIKSLEKEGVGRPSTYAIILKTIQERRYVTRHEKKIMPTDLGIIVNELLKKHFPEIIDITFTAKLEQKLDSIEEGTETSLKMLTEFFASLQKAIAEAKKKLSRIKIPVSTTCRECNSPMEIVYGKNGRFLACSKYPSCRCTSPLPASERLLKASLELSENMVDVTPYLSEKISAELGKCPDCGKDLSLKHGRFGEFIACSGYPECKYTRREKDIIPCPQDGCSGELIKRKGQRGRAFYGCSRYPECKYTTFQKPELCPDCKKVMIKKDKVWICPHCEKKD